MEKQKTILLTGAAGFIGSYLLGYLNQEGYNRIVIVDDFSEEDKYFNFDGKQFLAKVEREELFDRLESRNPGFEPGEIGIVIHLGARTDTTEFDYSIHERLNVEYSKKVWDFCAEKNIPLIYASSAATYGSGELGYRDDHGLTDKLQPLNPYGISKNEFDKWALRQPGDRQPPFWAGLKFFNVYGPNEYHKGRMASMIFHGYKQIRQKGLVKLFKSHRPDFKDGEQLRDFIYVKDIATVIDWMMNKVLSQLTTPGRSREQLLQSGLYNLGTGKARTFIDLITALFGSLGLKPDIEFIDMPEDIRHRYQYFTEAVMDKLQEAGYDKPFSSLEEGVRDYVVNYLAPRKYY